MCQEQAPASSPPSPAQLPWRSSCPGLSVLPPTPSPRSGGHRMSPACPPLCQQQGLGASSMAFWRREGWEAPTFLPLPPMQHPGGGERVGGRAGTLHPRWLLMLGRGGGTPEPCGDHGGGIVELRLVRSQAGGRGRGFTKGCRRSQHQLGAACGEQGSALRLGLGAGRRNSFALPLGDTARAPSKAQSIPGWFPPGPASPHPS